MTRDGRVRAGVVGAGNLGRHHARLYAARPDVELVAVVDVAADRAREVAERHGARPLTDFRDLASQIDVASVAVPTIAHHDVARALLEAGVHVLVEKPVTRTLEEASALREAARRAGRVLHVGHTERFNPAVQAVRPLVRRPRFIECERLNVFTPRGLDVDVVLDLMIHDLDVVLSLVDRPLEALDAIGVHAFTEQIDIANARLRFEGGAVANLTASRISVARSRKLRIFETQSYLSIDYPSFDVQHYVLRPQPEGLPTVSHEKVAVAEGEPLALEIDAFLQAASGGDDHGVSGADGQRALEVALRILRAIEESRETA